MFRLSPSEIRELIGEEAIANLKTLSEYLQSSNLRARFSMRYFSDAGSDSNEDYTATNCGTVGCAAGHGPYAGIPKHPTESWGDYSYRAFIGSELSDFEDFEDFDDEDDVERIWQWLFSSNWIDTDNTPEGAGQRIDYLLAHGLPNNVTEQMWGDAPLPYK